MKKSAAAAVFDGLLADERDSGASMLTISEPWSMERESYATRFAGLHFDTETGHLLVLSDESAPD